MGIEALLQNPLHHLLGVTNPRRKLTIRRRDFEPNRPVPQFPHAQMTDYRPNQKEL